MLTLTETAATEIRTIVENPEIPDDAGVRIATSPEGALSLALAAEPVSGDAVVDEAGARVFLEPAAEQLLTDKVLDAGVGPEGTVQFSIAEQV